MKTEIKFKKGDNDFTVIHDSNGFGSTYLKVRSSCKLMKQGDYEFDEQDSETNEIGGGYKDKQIKFNFAYVVTSSGQKFGGINLPDEVCTQLDELIAKDVKVAENNKADRENNRPAPRLDTEKYEVYNVGCDTGLIYHSNKKAIKLAIQKGAIVFPVLRGERNETNKYPGHMDDYIPVTHATKTGDKYSAEGYNYVYPEHYCIEKKEYLNALAEIETTREAAKNEKEQALQAKFEEARKTGNPVVINKIVLHESDTPLKNDGEGDMVDCVTLAMPDGTTKIEYYHNY